MARRHLAEGEPDSYGQGAMIGETRSKWWEAFECFQALTGFNTIGSCNHYTAGEGRGVARWCLIIGGVYVARIVGLCYRLALYDRYGRFGSLL